MGALPGGVRRVLGARFGGVTCGRRRLGEQGEKCTARPRNDVSVTSPTHRLHMCSCSCRGNALRHSCCACVGQCHKDSEHDGISGASLRHCIALLPAIVVLVTATASMSVFRELRGNSYVGHEGDRGARPASPATHPDPPTTHGWNGCLRSMYARTATAWARRTWMNRLSTPRPRSLPSCIRSQGHPPPSLPATLLWPLHFAFGHPFFHPP